MTVPATRKAAAYAIAAAALFGAGTPCSKLLLSGADPLFLAGVFYFSGGLFMLCFPGAIGELALLRRKRGRDAALLGGSVLSGGIAAPVLMLLGLRAIDAASASLLFSLEVAFTALLAGVVFGEHIGRRVIFSALLAVFSGALLAFQGQGLAFNLGAMLVAASCFCWALDNNLTARVEGISPAAATAAKGLAAGIVNLILWRLVAPGPLPEARVLAGAAAVGAFSYGLSTMLYVVSARQAGAARSQVLFSVNPFIGALISVAVFGAGILSVWQVAAAFGMLLALSGIYTENHDHGHAHPAQRHEHSHFHDDGHHAHPHESGEIAATAHSHMHEHAPLEHSHPHFPDQHHRHSH
ncbi:MAG: EamA family transporter [Elusimicrobia bacterium]|nr:EamA family transporter [Elusimicrobiota bacterium]